MAGAAGGRHRERASHSSLADLQPLQAWLPCSAVRTSPSRMDGEVRVQLQTLPELQLQMQQTQAPPVLTAHNEGRLGDCFGIHVPGTEVRRCLWEEWRGLGLGQRDHWRSLLARTPVSGVTTAVMLAAGPHAPILQETRLRSNECSASPGSNVSDAIKSEPEGDQSPAGKHLLIVAEWWLLAYGSSARCSSRRKQRPGPLASLVPVH